MRCELCGKETGATKPIFVEGTKLQVCPACTRFGDTHSRGGGSTSSVPNKSVIEERLERRRKRMSNRDVFAEDTEELVLDYQERIKDGRMKLGWDQEKLAKEVKEKKSVIAKVEAGDMIPPDPLVLKLEKTLGISLKEKVNTGGEIKASAGRSLTLGDFIHRE
ncbi:MAG: putative transcription factor [Candidatus Methanomethylophilaceae archaeon]|nr:putative transcription factor [Candidatus Methanomethylophilaceae archaeon]MDI3541167.1 putative transcription factor [Candidatus Methanomethylophilaceae archaeon]